MYLFTYSINDMGNSSPFVYVCFGNNLEHQSKPKATLEFVMTGVDFSFLIFSCCSVENLWLYV